MARVPLTEYAAKKLILGDKYSGVSITPDSLGDVSALTATTPYVVKVDAGIKKRGKRGLVAVNVSRDDIARTAQKYFDQGFPRCIVEPMTPHEESAERYLSIELTRSGARVLHGLHGGIDVESHHDTLTTHFISLTETLQGTPRTSPLDTVPLSNLLEKMARYQFSLLEVNPYVMTDGNWSALDMAVLIDSARAHALPPWAHEHIVERKAASREEEAVARQNSGSQASLNLHTLNKDGSILTLFSGGGASLVAMDALLASGLEGEIINYSEYSGAPTRDETRAYARTLLSVLFASPASRKVIVIAGGVANFTDVRETFRGLVDAFTETKEELLKQQVHIIVRRGGPHQEEGLSLLAAFCKVAGIPAEVNGPSLPLSAIGPLARTHLSL